MKNQKDLLPNQYYSKMYHTSAANVQTNESVMGKNLATQLLIKSIIILKSFLIWQGFKAGKFRYHPFWRCNKKGHINNIVEEFMTTRYIQNIRFCALINARFKSKHK